MRHQKADIRHLMIPRAGLGYILAPRPALSYLGPKVNAL